VVVALGFSVAVAAMFAWTRAGWLALAPDDATYLSVGRHLLAGEGPVRLDEPYLLRSPLFAGILALPGRLGFDLIGGAHWANLALTLGGCLAAGGLAWRWWGAPAGLLALGIAVAQPLAARLAPTLRIDPLSALLVLVAVGLATELGRSRSQATWHAVGLGIALGLALLAKETTLAMAGGIVLIPLAMGRPLRSLARDALVIGAAALLTSSWWLAWHGLLAGRLPYVPLPAIAIVPLVAAAVVALFVAWRWQPDPDPSEGALPGSLWVVAVLGALAWSVAATGLAIVATGQRAPAIDPGAVLGGFIELVPLWPFLLASLILGLVLAPRFPSLAPPTLAALGFVPIGVLVIASEFGARNFLVWSLLASVASAGLVWLALTRLAPDARWPRRPGRTGLAAAVIALGLVVGLSGLVSAAIAPAVDPRRAELEADLRAVARRMRSVAEPGSTIVATSPYASHLDLLLGARYEIRRLNPIRVRADPASPTGLARDVLEDRGPVGEVIALTYQARSRALLAFETDPATALLREPGTRYFVYITYAPVSPPWLVPRFDRASGFTRVAWLPLGERRRVYIYRLDPEQLELGDRAVLADANSLEALLDLLERRLDPSQEAAALRSLLPDGVDLGAAQGAAARRALDRLQKAMDG
jgi:4-amino-4-deoxy-L-arabinose transferase-like glycosyltransferase